MEGKKSQPRAILVFGAPCSGKSTFCDQFSHQFKAPFFDLDELKQIYKLSRPQIIMLVQQLAKTQQTLIIEGAIGSFAEREELRDLLLTAGYLPSLVWIQTDVITIKNRLKNRLKSLSKAKAEYEQRIKELEAPLESENAIVLSGKHTFQTQLRHVLTQLPNAHTRP